MFWCSPAAACRDGSEGNALGAGAAVAEDEAEEWRTGAGDVRVDIVDVAGARDGEPVDDLRVRGEVVGSQVEGDARHRAHDANA